MRRLTLSVNIASAPTGSCRATPRSRAKVVGPFRRRLDGHRAVAAGLQDNATNCGARPPCRPTPPEPSPPGSRTTQRIWSASAVPASRARVDEEGGRCGRIDRPPTSRPRRPRSPCAASSGRLALDGLLESVPGPSAARAGRAAPPSLPCSPPHAQLGARRRPPEQVVASRSSRGGQASSRARPDPGQRSPQPRA